MTSRMMVIPAAFFLFSLSASAIDYPWEIKKLKLADTGETLRLKDVLY